MRELRPVYTSFTPGWVAAARRERSPRVHSAAQFLAEQEVSPPPPSSDNGTRDLPAAALVFFQKNEVGSTLCGSESFLDFSKKKERQNRPGNEPGHSLPTRRALSPPCQLHLVFPFLPPLLGRHALPPAPIGGLSCLALASHPARPLGREQGPGPAPLGSYFSPSHLPLCSAVSSLLRAI